MSRLDEKLIPVYLTKSQDDEFRKIAHALSTDNCKISVSELIRAALCGALGQMQYIDKDALKAFIELGVDWSELQEMDKETIKNLVAIMK